MQGAVGGTFVIAFFLATSAGAQQLPTPPVSMERVRIALQKPSLSLSLPPVPLVAPRTTPLGILTLVPPRSDGEVVRVAIPLGELISRAFDAASDARRRRAEKKAHERVMRALEEFQRDLERR